MRTTRIVLFAFMAACGGSKTPRATQDGGVPQGFCTSDANCQGGLVCVGGQCKEAQTPADERCAAHQDCAIGQFCNSATRACVQCLADEHCEVGESCRNGTCASGAPGSCTTDFECAAGEVCIGGGCQRRVVPARECSTNQDCAPDFCQLTTGLCVDCLTSAQCAHGQTCQNNICTNPTTTNCTRPADCPAGDGCFLGSCGACFLDGDCRAAETCALDGTCRSTTAGCQSSANCQNGQVCSGGACRGCVNTAECPANTECRQSRCQAPQTPPQCASRADCTGGQICQNARCQACTSNAQCSTGETCRAGACAPTTTTPPPPPPAAGNLGAACASQEACGQGQWCLDMGQGGVCTRLCIGSGKGGEADCPSGFACFDTYDGLYDGLSLCLDGTQIPAEYPGRPFDQAPGASCASGNACQTSVCYNDVQTCARSCAADRDCAAGEVCWSIVTNEGIVYNLHECFPSDPAFSATGDSCSSHTQCDSGLCAGVCEEDLAPCQSDFDCGLFSSCISECRDHCRSNADCASGESCGLWPTQMRDDGSPFGWVATCMPKYFDGAKADGQACAAHGECKSDYCVGGICTTPCALTADCVGGLSGKLCEPRYFVGIDDNPAGAIGFCN